MPPNREGDIPSIRGNCRTAKDLRILGTPQLASNTVGEFPDALARTIVRNIQKVVRTEARGESRTGIQWDSSRCRQRGG